MDYQATLRGALKRRANVEQRLTFSRSIALGRDLLGAGVKPDLGRAVKALQDEWDVPSCDDAPILLLSAGWRSGSTALQRLCNTDPEVLVWGEPYLDSHLLQNLAKTLLPMDPVGGRFFHTFPDEVDLDNLGLEWTATLMPRPAHIIEGLRAGFRRMFAESASELGRPVWGIKEVIVDGDGARAFAALFPKARIVFLVRNPYDAYASYRPRSGHPWYADWPRDPVTGPVRFGRLWRHLTTSFQDAADELGALLVRMEDLNEPETLKLIEKHLGVSPDRATLGTRVGSSKDREGARLLPAWELAALRRIVGPTAEQFGYTPTGTKAD